VNDGNAKMEDIVRTLQDPEKVEVKLQELLKDYQSKNEKQSLIEENASASTKNQSMTKRETDEEYVTPIQKDATKQGN